MALEGMRVLVTGSSGFIGGHLVAGLRQRGAQVLTLDLKQSESVDVSDWNKVREFTETIGKIDLVCHLAALLFVPYAYENPWEIYNVNVLGTLNILELCRIKDIEKIVFASSYIYGRPQYLPIDEEHPHNPNNPYARSKVIGEDLCRAYHEDYGLNCVILRPFNIYGEGQIGDLLIPSILRQLPSGTIALMDREPKRDFLYISDVIEAYIAAAEYTKSAFEVFNIGSGVSYSVDEIANRIVQVWGQGAVVYYGKEKRKGEIDDVVADVKKAGYKLGWLPKVDIDVGLTRVVESYKKGVYEK